MSKIWYTVTARSVSGYSNVHSRRKKHFKYSVFKKVIEKEYILKFSVHFVIYLDIWLMNISIYLLSILMDIKVTNAKYKQNKQNLIGGGRTASLQFA